MSIRHNLFKTIIDDLLNLSSGSHISTRKRYIGLTMKIQDTVFIGKKCDWGTMAPDFACPCGTVWVPGLHILFHISKKFLVILSV